MALSFPKPNVLKDIDAYPVLTEEVGYPPSPVSRPVGMPSTVPGTAPIGQVATKAIADVLGWKLKDGDAKGFVGALTQAFTLKDVEGHVESQWVPRTYAIQTDLAGGVTGAQASVFTRAKEAVDQSLPLIDGLYALNPEADADDVTALKAVLKSQLTELVNELGTVGGPRIQRVNQYFTLLLGGSFPTQPSQNAAVTPTDPDQIAGTLGDLRDLLGVNFSGQDFINTVADETNLSNYRVVADYMTSIAQTWLNNFDFFHLDSTTKFFGTQLVLISRQLSVVAESVDEVRFALDSVFIGPAERQTLKLNFSGTQPPMFAEDLYNWVQSFAAEEGPRLIQDGGKFAVQNTFYPIVRRLTILIHESQGPFNPNIPPAYSTARVQRALSQLEGELTSLANLSRPIRHVVTPQPEFSLPLSVSGVDPSSITVADLNDAIVNNGLIQVLVFGAGFEAPPQAGGVTLANTTQGPIPCSQVYFRSQGCLVALFDPRLLRVGYDYDVQVANPDNTSSRPLRAGLSVTLV
jgi:hypothetical protein